MFDCRERHPGVFPHLERLIRSNRAASRPDSALAVRRFYRVSRRRASARTVFREFGRPRKRPDLRSPAIRCFPDSVYDRSQSPRNRRHLAMFRSALKLGARGRDCRQSREIRRLEASRATSPANRIYSTPESPRAVKIVNRETSTFQWRNLQ